MKATCSIKSLVILGILASHQGYVRSESNCDDNAKLQYEAGKSYVYNLGQVSYDTTRNDWVRFDRVLEGEKIWGPRSRGKITVSGKVVLTALESCQFAITLQEVVTHITGERVGDAVDGRDGIVPRTSMLFTFKNGEVSNLYKQAGESTIWSENILRGILTMIQNKGLGSSEGEPVEKETNIKGDCLARIYIPQEGHYKKTIFSGQCSDPVITPSEGVPYDTTGHGIERPHFDHSTSFVRCQNNVTNGLVSDVSCLEMNELPKLRLFRHTGETQSTFTLEQAAVDTNEVGGVTSTEISALTEATSMNYDPRRAQADMSWEEDVLTEALALSKAMHLDSDLNRAEQYLKLKEILAFVKDFQKLEELIQADSQDDPMKTQFILNMVRNIATEIGTEGAVLYISSLIHNKTLEAGPKAVFHTHLHLTKDATLEGLKALDVMVQDTLDEYNKGGILDSINVFSDRKRMIRQQLLGISAYAYQFCRKTPSCGEVPEYQELIGKISQFAPSKLPDLTHAALQSLGNVPSLPDSAVKVVAEILEQGGSIFNGGSTKLLTAFEAFRRDPCNPTLKQATREIFSDKDQSLEVQLTAYMALARCLDEEDLKAINEVFESAPLSPRSSFIASHVHNIMDSQSPSKIPLKTGLLSQISIPESVLTVHNMSKTSKFVEYSTFHPDKNLGFSAEAAIFFQGNSLPQFIQANWTVDLFGKSYNKFQAGLSNRLVSSISRTKVASVMNFFNVEYDSVMLEIMPMLFAMDSYYRIFGTTVAMGIDAIETLKAHQFFDHRKDPETQMLKFDFVKAFTLLDHDIRVPTISGLPLTFSVNAAYLPMVAASHIGNTNGIGFKDLLTNWDEETGVFAHNSSSDSALVLGYGVSVGKGTPVHLGYKAVAKVRVNHSIGFESAMEEGGWLKTIHFPDMTVASLRLTAVRQFFVEYNGHEFQKWNIFGDLMPMAPEQIFKVGGFMGLQANGQFLSRPHQDMEAPLDMLFKVEKTEEQFTGYGLAIELKDEGESMKKFGVKAMAYGLSTEDTIRFYVNYTDIGVHDLESFDEKPSLAITLYADMTQRLLKATGLLLKYKSTGHKKSELSESVNFSEFFSAGILSGPTLGLVVRPEYSLEVEAINEGDKQRLLDWTIHNGKQDANMSMKFSGPLAKLAGEVEMIVSREILYSDNQNPIHVRPRMTLVRKFEIGNEVSVKFSQKSEDLGTNKLAVGFFVDDTKAWLNSTVEIQEVTYDLTQQVNIPKVQDTIDVENLKSSIMEVGYRASYKDSNGIKASTTVQHIHQRKDLGDNQVTDTRNASLRVLSGEEDMEALIVEFNLVHEMDYNNEIVHDELKRRSLNVYVVSYEKKQAELNFDHKYTETGIDDENECKVGRVIYRGKDGKSYRCRTHNIMTNLMVPDHFEGISTFDNDQRHSLKKVIKAYLTESQVKFNLTYDLNFPLVRNGMGVESKAAILLENIVGRGEDWKIDSNLDLDLENRTLELTSETKQQVSQEEPATWSLSVSGNWENDNVWVGESNLNIRHQCPANNVLTVDIQNRGNQTMLRDATVFTNVLTALIGEQGRSKIYNPKKKFTWNSVSDWGLTNDEKTLYDFGWKWNSEMKLEKMLDQPEEIFCYKESANFFKMLNQESWKFKDGQLSLILEGQEKAAGSWDLSFSIIPEHHSQNKKKSESITEVSHNTPTSISSTHIQLMASMDGWFEQEVPRNNTIHLRHKYDFLPYETRIMSFTDFFLKTTDVNDGSEVFKIDMTAVKDAYFKDLLHFSHFERFNMDIDNITWALSKDIRVNGPHLAVHIKSDGETVEDSWLIDFDGGLFEEKHQHKLNFQGKSGYKADHNMHNRHLHRVDGGIIPYTNFNVTVSRRR